ncbi:MAG: MucB/RseB C-terminal domain-containing protein [Gammaproteobacteria bacterium]
MLKRLSIICCLLLNSSVFADETQLSPSQSLLKMQQAMELLNFQGTVAFLRNGKLNTLKYYHASSGGGDQERLVSLNSPLHEIIRDADKVSCFMSSSSKVIVDHRPSARSFLIDLPENLDGLDPYYRFEFSGEEQVAMLTTFVLNILPKDNYRYARRIWIEKQQYLPLKVEVYDHSNNIIEQVVFTELQLKASMPVVDADAATVGREVQHIHKRSPDSFEKARFDLEQVPGGFRKQFFIQMAMRDADQPVEHLLLTDGFSSVSVYLENKNENVELGPHASGSVNAFSRILGGYLVTVMGEVPAATVQYIAEGVKLRTEGE